MTWLDDNAEWLAAARQHWAPQRSEQVQIRAWFSQPIAFDGYDQITIEGGLQSVVCSLETGRMPDDVFVRSPRDATVDQADIQIPICDVHIDTGIGPLPVACVSSGWFSPDATQTVRWIRCRPRAESYAMKTVNVAMAEFKATNNPVATVTANYLDFWALGDADLLRRLLADLPQLGADRSCGMGSVHGWEVTVHPESTHWPSWQSETGRIMRAMPHGYMRNATHYDTRQATLRAPYWLKRTQVLCDVPIQEIGRTS